MYYKLSVVETARNTLKEVPIAFNHEVKTARTLEAIKEAIIDRYGKLPRRTPARTIYRDTANGEAMPVGMMHSYWNRDISHNSPSWYQTDWIEITAVDESPVLL